MTESTTERTIPPGFTALDVAEFTYEGAPVRAILIDHEPWFVIHDVCDILSMPVMHAVWMVRTETDNIDRRCLGKGRTALRTTGGGGSVWFVSEYGLHELILKRAGQKRRAFRRWIIDEVLPTLRHHGPSSTRRIDLPFKVQRVNVARKRPPSQRWVTASQGPCVLYRLFDADDVLLYVGISSKVYRRLNGHRRVQPWWSAVTSVRIETYPTKDAALAAEALAIRTEGPRHNITHARDPKDCSVVTTSAADPGVR